MEHSTSINELPIDNSQVSNNSENGIPQNNRGSETTTNIQMDPQIIPNQVPTSEMHAKNVNIREDKNKIHTFDKNDNVSEVTIIDDNTKIIILATVIFFVFQDGKVKNYILNILCQIFGKFLKTDLGNISKIGTLFYSFVFGLVIYIIIKLIDVKKLNLNI